MSNSNEIEPEQLLVDYPILLKQFRNAEPTSIETLFQEVDESGFALVDWLDSLTVLYKWLDRDGLTLSLENGLGYVACAAKSVGNSSTLTHLPLLVSDFLEQYGCDLAVRK